MAEIFAQLNRMRTRTGNARTSRVMELLVAEGLAQLDAGAYEFFRRKYLPLIRYWEHSDEVRDDPDEAFDALYEHLTFKKKPNRATGSQIDKFTGAGSFISWLKRVSFNFFIERARKKERELNKAKSKLEQQPQPVTPDVISADCSPQLPLHILEQLNRVGLTQTEAELLVRLMLDGAKGKDVATDQGVSEGTISRRYQKALEKVKLALERAVCDASCIDQCSGRVAPLFAVALGELSVRRANDESH